MAQEKKATSPNDVACQSPPPVKYGVGAPLCPTGDSFRGKTGTGDPNKNGDHPIEIIISQPGVTVELVRITSGGVRGEWMYVDNGPIPTNCSFSENQECVDHLCYDILCRVPSNQHTTISVAYRSDGGTLMVAETAEFTPNPHPNPEPCPPGDYQFTIIWTE